MILITSFTFSYSHFQRRRALATQSFATHEETQPRRQGNEDGSRHVTTSFTFSFVLPFSFCYIQNVYHHITFIFLMFFYVKRKVRFSA